MRIIEALLGMYFIFIVLNDVFQTVVVPSLGYTRFRLLPLVVGRVMWPIWRNFSHKIKNPQAHKDFLAIFAPLSVVSILVVWITFLLLGYALVLFSIRDGTTPPLVDLQSAFYFAGTSVFTIGFGDITPTGRVARMVILIAAVSGLTTMALVTSLVFSIHSAYQRRENFILMLEGRAGDPPSGLTLFKNVGLNEMQNELLPFFATWEMWCAEVLTSHSSYTFLLFFRSKPLNSSWLTALGCILDATVLYQSVAKMNMQGQARLTYSMGIRLLTEFATYFDFKRHEYISEHDREVFMHARAVLEKSGYELRPEPESWQKFTELRAGYYSLMHSFSQHLAMPCCTLLSSEQEPKSVGMAQSA
jgi:Ion channel